LKFNTQFGTALTEHSKSLIGSVFLNGGPVAIVYGFLSTFFGILAINASLAEMASMYVLYLPMIMFERAGK
jgi:amino acid permease